MIKMSVKRERVGISVPIDIAKLVGLDKPNVLYDAWVGYGPEFGQLKIAPAQNGKGGKITKKPGATTLNFSFPAPVLWGERESELMRVDFTVKDDELVINAPFYTEVRELPPTGNTKVTNGLAQQMINLFTQGKSRAKVAELIGVSEQTVETYTSTPEIKRQHDSALLAWREKRQELEEQRQRQAVTVTRCPPRPAAGIIKKVR